MISKEMEKVIKNFSDRRSKKENTIYRVKHRNDLNFY